MTIRILSLVLGMLILTVFLSPVAAEARGGRGRGGRGGRDGAKALESRFQAIEAVPLTEQEVGELTYLREEEKLARDVYRTLGKMWSLPVFTNIGEAEQRHLDHVALLFNTYELPDPIADDTVGVFVNPELSALYVELVAKGTATLVDALQVGAHIEDLDIADLDDLLELSKNDHVRLVAQNLVKGSRNHLRAFMRALAAHDATYVPQHLSVEAFEAILAGDQERGPVDENGESLQSGRGQRGSGQGRGQGQGQGQGRGCGRGQGRRACDGSCDGAGPKHDGSGRGQRGGGRRGRGRDDA